MSSQPITPPKGIQVQSAPPAKQLTPEERKKLLTSLRERMGRSQIETTPPAGKVGYWAHTTDTREMGRLQWVGFQIVHDDPAKPAWKANGIKEDGTYVCGDVILMEIDEQIYELLQQEYIDINEAQRKNAPQVFISDADAKGVPTFEVAKPRR
jgi:hypothetical protein